MRSSAGATWRLFKISLPSALAMSAPLWLLVGWYAWSAYARFDRYRDAAEPNEPLTLQAFQVALHDELSQDVRRMLLPDRPEHPTLPTFELSLSNAELDALERVPPDPDQDWVKGSLRTNGKAHDVRIRQRGERHWHWLGPQKTLKLKTDRGDLVEGVESFNLVNDVTPLGLEEDVLFELAREQGLLAPHYYPIRVRINNADMGVYRFEEQIEEGLLRRGKRVPGSILSGNLRPTGVQTGVGELWGQPEAWRKVAAKNGSTQEDMSDLGPILAAVADDDLAQFQRFARERLDLMRFAKLSALDVVFAVDQHDYVSNQKLFLDHYRGRIEPIAWAMRGFKDDVAFDLAQSPLTLRLELLPEFGWQRDHLAYELISGAGAVASLRQRFNHAFDTLRPELEADPYWDAYKLLPATTRFNKFMVRPMSTPRWLLAANDVLTTLDTRHRRLLDLLENTQLEILAQRAPAGTTIELQATVAGHTALRLTEVLPLGPCRGRLELLALPPPAGQPVLLGASAAGTPIALSRYQTLTPGAQIALREASEQQRNPFTLTKQPQRYRYELRANDCAPTQLRLSFDNLVTGARIEREVTIHLGSLPPAAPAPCCSTPLKAGTLAPHPWQLLPELPTTLVTLGPGVVRVDRAREYGEHESVRILAGTTLALGEHVSLVFRGPVSAIGTAVAPIRIEAANPAKPFGGIALVGPGTAGAHLEEVSFLHGSSPSQSSVELPGLLNLQDTAHITLKNLRLSAIAANDNTVHAAYVDDLQIDGLRIYNSPNDALDLEFVRGTLRDVWVLGAGDEALDLMGSAIEIYDSVLVDSANNAISAGEETSLVAHGLVIARAKHGVLAKNASRVNLRRSLIWETEKGIVTHRKDVYYDAPSFIAVQDLYLVDCEEETDIHKDTEVDLGRTSASLAEEPGSRHLLQELLGIQTLDDLPERLSRAASGSQQ